MKYFFITTLFLLLISISTSSLIFVALAQNETTNEDVFTKANVDIYLKELNLPESERVNVTREVLEDFFCFYR